MGEKRKRNASSAAAAATAPEKKKKQEQEQKQPQKQPQKQSQAVPQAVPQALPASSAASAAKAGSGTLGKVVVVLPGSALEWAGELGEQQTLVAAQLARALLLFGVHEVCVYRDEAKPQPPLQEGEEQPGAEQPEAASAGEGGWSAEWLCRQLEWFECPPHLRRTLTQGSGETEEGGPHEALSHCMQLGGRMDAVHHVRSSDWVRFREGVLGDDRKSVDIGLSKRGILVDGPADRSIEPGTRVTFEFEKEVTRESEIYRGRIVPVEKPIVESRSRLSWGCVVKAAPGEGSLVEALAEEGLAGVSEEGQTVRILLDWREGLSMKKVESKLVGELLGKRGAAKVVIVVGPLNGTNGGGRLSEEEKKQCKFDIVLNPVEMPQCRFVKAEEILWCGLAMLRTPLAAWLANRKRDAAAGAGAGAAAAGRK